MVATDADDPFLFSRTVVFFAVSRFCLYLTGFLLVREFEEARAFWRLRFFALRRPCARAGGRWSALGAVVTSCCRSSSQSRNSEFLCSVVYFDPREFILFLLQMYLLLGLSSTMSSFGGVMNRTTVLM